MNTMSTQKIAEELEEVLNPQEESLVKRLIPDAVMLLLRRAFTPRGFPFFEFYPLLKRIEMGEPVPPDIRMQYVKNANRLAQITSPVDGRGLSPSVVNQIVEARPEMTMLLHRLESGRTDDTTTWRKINEILTSLFLEIARDKDIYLSATPMGSRRWPVFRRMRGNQEKTEKLRDTDPESYALVMKYHQTLEEIDTAVRKRIQDAGLELREGFMMGRPVLYGRDPKTGEERIYDLDGEVLDREAYIEKRRAKDEANKKITRTPTRTDVPLRELRTISPEEIDMLSGPVEMSALTDDIAKQGRLTRILPTKRKPVFIAGPEGVRVEYQKVIVSGRYKGIFLDDMVNSTGRLIEGTAYTYSAVTGRSEKVPKRIDPSQREPYVTVADVVTVRQVQGKKVKTREQKLFLKIPGTKEYTDLRLAIKDLSCNTGTIRGCIPSVSYHAVEGSRSASFYFDPKDFGVVMDTLQGMSLSAAALDLIRTYYKDLSRADQATAEENLRPYSLENLGGFKPRRKNRATGEWEPVDLLVKQKQAMAWMDANGGRGVCALDTGIGKCVREDTLIATDRGLFLIKEMNPGLSEPDTTAPVKGFNVVIGGKTLPVKNFYFGGPKPTIRVTTRRGYEVEGSRIHPLLVRTPDEQETWVQTPDLEAGDYLCIERTGGVFALEDPPLSVPVPEDFQQVSRNSDKTFTNPQVRVFPVPDRMSPDMGRLLGYVVAEGWTNHHRYFSISQCPEKNPEVRADIEHLLREYLGWEPKPDKDIYISSVFLREYLTRMGVGMGVAKDKVIPPIIFRSSRETVRNFVRALVDAEGSVKGRASRIEFTTASEQLGRELQVLLLQFGILCTRSPKKVSGYDHTYWRITITGEDARLYWDTIGFVSQRKQQAFEEMPDTRNGNLDVVPHVAACVGSLFDAVLSASNLTVSRVREQQGNSFDITVCHIRRGRRNPTYPFLMKLLTWAANHGCQTHPAFQTISAVVTRNLFYDPIRKLEESEAVVVDIEVDDPAHCFVGNGLVNHNTLTSIAVMQKMIRDGQADEDAAYTTPTGKTVKTNGRFLYVCPKSLRGNLAKEIANFISDPKVLLNRVDVLSYREFSGSSRTKKIPRPLRGVDFWQNLGRWDPALYTAIFFDEAQGLKNIENGASQAALKLWHPHKVCLTASPMERNPMEAYVLAAVTNNTPLFGRSPEAQNNRQEMRRFKERFCEVIGGRIVGVRQDPLAKRDLHTWVKRNVFHADKQDVEEFQLPGLKVEAEAVEMPPAVEIAYRSVTKQFPRLMKGLVAKFRDRGMGEGSTEARDPNLERAFGRTFRPILKLLTELANYPEIALGDMAHMMESGTLPYQDASGQNPPLPKVLQWAVSELSGQMTPDRLREVASSMTNPKIARAEDIIRQKIDQTNGSSRTLLFSDDKRFCLMAGRQMAAKIAGKHIVALNDRILIFDGSGPLSEVTFEMDVEIVGRLVKDPEERDRIMQATGGFARHEIPFRELSYKKFPDLPAGPGNPSYRANQWQQFVMKEVVTPDTSIRSMTLHGPTYQYGFNLQEFDTVIHLDRDNWNSESMKQRTARSWRQGQDKPVNEFTLDTTYAASLDGTPRDEFDKTLDEIRRYFQQMDAEVFDRVIRDAQGIDLGKEWIEMSQKDSSLLRLDRKVMEMMLSPYVGRAAEV